MSCKPLKNKNRGSQSKLKTILANPFKEKCPTLNEMDFQQFEELIRDTLGEDQPRAQALKKRMQLGLASTLRAINNCECSCVFLSLSIKPRHVIRLVARNMEIKDGTVPVFVQPLLEIFTERVFGVSALAFALPSATKELGGELDQWVASRRQHVKPRTILEVPKLDKVKRAKPAMPAKPIHEVIPKKTVAHSRKSLDFTESYISFSHEDSKMNDDVLELVEEKELLMNTLKGIASHSGKAKEKSKIQENSHGSSVNPHGADIMNQDVPVESDSDDFLDESSYRPLTVHKVLPNPMKPQKRKRNKKKNNKK